MPLKNCVDANLAFPLQGDFYSSHNYVLVTARKILVKFLCEKLLTPRIMDVLKYFLGFQSYIEEAARKINLYSLEE